MTGPGCSSKSITFNGRQGADELAALHEAQQAHEAPSPYPTRTLPLIATLVLT
jgi:hypothetical protein